VELVRESIGRKQKAVRVLTAVNVLLVLFNLYCLWVLASFAAGLVWWAGMLFVVSGPLALTTLVLSAMRPIQIGNLCISGILVIGYSLLWFMLLAAS
jgi:hypothetical protein